MPIQFSCTNCGSVFKVPDQYAGKKTKCRKCNALLSIPSADEEPNLGFADEESSPVPSARPLAAPMRDRDDPPDLSGLEGDGEAGVGGGIRMGPPPLMKGLPKVARASGGDADVLDYRPAAGRPRVSSGREPSRARDDGISKLLVILAVLITLVVTVHGYVNWPPEEMKTLLAKNELPADLLNSLGRPHSLLLLPSAAMLLSVFLIMAPAVLLSWFIATRIMNTSLPSDAYARCLGLACLPIVMVTIANQTPLANDPIMRAVLVLLTVPVGWLLMSTVHGARLGETALTLVFSVVFGFVGLFLTLMVVGGVVFATGMGYQARVKTVVQNHVQQKQQESRERIAAEQRQQMEAAAKQRQEQIDRINAERTERMNALRGSFGSPAVPTNPHVAPPQPQQDTGDLAVNRIRRQVESLLSAITDGSRTRDSAAADLASLRTSIGEAKQRYASRGEWAEFETKLAEAEPKIAALPSSKPDEKIFQAISPTEQWTIGTQNVEHELSLGPVNFRIPAGGKLKPNPKVTDALEFDGANQSTSLRVKLVAVIDEKQQQPWLAVSGTQPDEKVFAVDVGKQPAISAGKFGEIPFVRVADNGSGKPGENERRRITYAARLPAHWLVFQIASSWHNEDGLETLVTSVATCRMRKPNEAAVDPMSPKLLLAQAGERPSAEMLAALSARKVETEAEILSALDKDSSEGLLKKYSGILPAVASEKSVKYLWRMAAAGQPNSAQARTALQQVDPKNVDAVRFATLDITGGWRDDSKRALEVLADAPVDAKRKNEVSKVLLAALEDRSYAWHNGGETLEAVLAKWGNEQVHAVLVKELSADSFMGSHLRKSAIGALSRTGAAKHAPVIARWVLKESDAVKQGLKRLGAAGETEAMKLLGMPEADARKHAAGVLEEIGTAKCLPALARAMKDPRDPVAAAAAQGAYEIVKERVDAAKAAAAAATQPAAK